MNLTDNIKQTFPTEIDFPMELQLLCEWVEENGYDSIATDFRLGAAPNLVSSYFHNGGKLEKHLVAFANSSDGGIFALWRTNEGQKVVHLGSEGNNWFVLADDFADFVATLAIGYSNLAEDDLLNPPVGNGPDAKFKTWVETKFGLRIPDSAKNIDKTDRAFTRWVFNTLQPGVDFDQFDPDSKHNLEFHSLEYRLLVSKIPENKSKFIGDLRKVSTLSISELMKGLNNLPIVVYEGSTYFNGQLSLKNFPSADKEALIYLTENYKDAVTLEYRKNVKQSEKTGFKELG